MLHFAQCLYEKLVECSFPNNLSPNDTVGALTFVQALEEHIGGDIEAVCARTIGLKNIDVPEVLGDKPLPMEVRRKSGICLRVSL